MTDILDPRAGTPAQCREAGYRLGAYMERYPGRQFRKNELVAQLGSAVGFHYRLGYARQYAEDRHHYIPPARLLGGEHFYCYVIPASAELSRVPVLNRDRQIVGSLAHQLYGLRFQAEHDPDPMFKELFALKAFTHEQALQLDERYHQTLERFVEIRKAERGRAS